MVRVEGDAVTGYVVLALVSEIVGRHLGQPVYLLSEEELRVIGVGFINAEFVESGVRSVVVSVEILEVCQDQVKLAFLADFDIVEGEHKTEDVEVERSKKHPVGVVDFTPELRPHHIVHSVLFFHPVHLQIYVSQGIVPLQFSILVRFRQVRWIVEGQHHRLVPLKVNTQFLFLALFPTLPQLCRNGLV